MIKLINTIDKDNANIIVELDNGIYGVNHENGYCGIYAVDDDDNNTLYQLSNLLKSDKKTPLEIINYLWGVNRWLKKDKQKL